MKSSAIVSAIVAATLAAGSFSAFAQGRMYDRNTANSAESYGQNRNERGDRRDFERRGDRRDFNRDDRRNYNRGDYNQQRYYYGARGPEWRRGGYIPREYYNRQYYVNDWRGHQLSAPPRGYQWVQVGSDYVLIALATGLIANLILNQ